MKRCVLICLVVILLLTACGETPSETTEPPVPTFTYLDLPRSERLASDFTVKDGIVSYPGAQLGMDTASHQGQIDWESVKADGVSFVILQLGYRGYTEGTLNEDSVFRESLKKAKQTGLSVGVYFFSQALSVEEAREEAQFVVDVLDGAALDLPVFFDWEEVPDGRTGGKANGVVTDCAVAFCQRIRQSGYRPGVYFNCLYGYTLFRLEELKDYEFWLADYGTHPSFFYDVSIWQFTGSAKLDGIENTVDLDLYFPPEEEAK